MNSKPCAFYQNNTCRLGNSCNYSHQTPISRTKPHSSGICPYFLKGTCAFGDRCQRSHKVELKEVKANNYNEGGSSVNESPAEDSEIPQSDKRSASRGEGENVQEDVQESPPSVHLLDPPPQKEDAEPEVQDSGLSRDDVSDPLSFSLKEINVNEENTDKEPCIFFLDGSCANDSACEFSHSIPKGTSSSVRQGPTNSGKSFCHIFVFP